MTQSATERPRRRPRFRRLTKIMAVGALVATFAGTTFAESADAARLSASGTVGAVGLPTGKCTYYPNWGRLDVAVAPPGIYAPNLRAGSGNDSSWVRYQVFVIDRYKNLVSSSNPSGWALAYDSQAASFAGTTRFSGIPDLSTVWIYVEWYGAGNAVFKLDRYQNYVSGVTLPYGPGDSCSKYTPPGYVIY